MLAALSSVWLGIVTLSLLLVYMSIGSAVPPFRQLPVFEMTEFEWFNWWPFLVMVGIVCLNITVVTLRRIPLNRMKLGVWMTHTGLLVMAVGGVLYFSTKIEADTVVIRRQMEIATPDGRRGTMVALPGARARLGEYDFEITEIHPQWPMLTDGHEGQTAYSVMVHVHGPDGGFTRQLLDGHPAYTEDILPGQGRAISAVGSRLVDEGLSLELTPWVQREYYIADSRALYLRPVEGDRSERNADSHDGVYTPWAMRPLADLPRYNDYVSDPASVWAVQPGERLIERPELAVATPAEGDPLPDVDVSVVGYLRYAMPEQRWVEGDGALEPVLEAVAKAVDSGAERSFRLHAFDPARRATRGGEVRFVWIEDEAELEEALEPAPARLTLRVEGVEDPVVLEVDGAQRETDEDRPWTPIGESQEASGYAHRLRFVSDGLALADGRRLSVAVIDLRTPDGEFTRWVSDDRSFVRDMPPGVEDFAQAGEIDERIDVDYRPGRPAAPVTLVGGPGESDLRAVLRDESGQVVGQEPVRIGEPFTAAAGVELRVDTLMPRAKREVRPAITPRRQRERDAREHYSMIRVRIEEPGSEPVERWLPFNRFPFPTENYGYRNRFTHSTAQVRLNDGREVELMFSRERRALPTPVHLRDFSITTRIGGFTGRTSSIRDWHSDLVFEHPEDGQINQEISTNDPASVGGLWFFQASWDPPQNDPRTGTAAGLNYTGLGVGNRNGVYTMLAGCGLMVIGLCYAFYIKPILKRREAAQLQRALSARPSEDEAAHAKIPVEEADNLDQNAGSPRPAEPVVAVVASGDARVTSVSEHAGGER